MNQDPERETVVIFLNLSTTYSGLVVMRYHLYYLTYVGFFGGVPSIP